MSKLQERLKALQIEGYDPKTETWSPPSEQPTFTPNNSAGISDAQFNQLLGEIDVKRGELNSLKQDVIQTANTIKDKLNNELSERTGQPIERIQEDTDRDFYMSPSEAVEYGIIDNIFNKRPINSV